MEQILVLIRHGKPENEGYADEKLRPLSPEGATATRRVLSKLDEAGYAPDHVYSSPLLRAQQTASEAGREVETLEALGYDFDGEEVLRRVHQSGSRVTYCFGHMPSLADFVNEVCGELVLPDGLRTSEAAVIRLSESSPQFMELINPT